MKPYEYNLRKLMQQKKMSSKELAEKSGVAQSRIYDILRGERYSPRYETLEKLAKALGVSVSELVEEKKRKKK